MKPTFCVHLCWIILDVYRFIGLIRKSQHILTFHFPHNFQEFHGIALFPVWCGPAVQRREKLTFLQAPRAKAYDSRFSQLLDHDDVRFPSVGIPRLRQLREVDLLFARLIHKFVCWYCWDLCYCYTGFELLLLLQLCFCTSWMFIMNIQLFWLFLCVFFNGFIHPFFFNNFWLSVVLSGHHLRSRQIFRCGDFVGGRGCLRIQGPVVQWWGSEGSFAGKQKSSSRKN